MAFQNLQISPSELPSVSEIEFHKVSPAYKNVEYLSVLIFYGVMLIGWFLFFLLNTLQMPWINWLVLFLWCLFFMVSMYFASKRYKSIGYALREHDILYKHGVLFKSTTSLPFSRIQHSEISQGPLESMFGLATLKIYTAGGAGSDLAIEGLPHQTALNIKDFIAERTGTLSESSES